ncbi:MAG: hypothetical protein WBP45_10165, partial [Daejeonella sp.]
INSKFMKNNKDKEEENKTPLSKTDQDKIDKIYEEAQFLKSVKEELRTEERFVNYFKDFHPKSVDSFIDNYAYKRFLWMRYGPMYKKLNDEEDTKWINTAYEHLGFIQQKKLFDAQCLWRAEKVKFEGVQICYDFHYWEETVLYCPFIEPLNEGDINLYMEYLNQNNADISSHFRDSWQDYDGIKDAYNNEEAYRDFPEWYDFYNTRKGTGAYLILPDIRGKKEEFYRELYFEEKNKAYREEVKKQEEVTEKRPWLKDTYDKEHLTFFVNTFEDKQTQIYFKAYERNCYDSEEEEFEEIVRFLLAAGEPIPISAQYDFRDALRQARDQYTAKKIAEFLPYALEQHRLNLSIGVSLDETELKSREVRKERRNKLIEIILAGRKLNGEPEDFNY